MNDLIAFLAARLDEDEAAALAASDDGKARSWTSFDIGGYPVIGAGVDDGWGVTVVGPPAPSEAQVRHIARHDPARALREVEAGRAIIAAHGPDPINQFGSVRSPLCLVCLTDREGYEEMWEADPWPCLVLRQIAAVFSDHPDYRPEWNFMPLP